MHDPFGRSRLPGDFSREGRIALLGEAAGALFQGQVPSKEAAIFLASALTAWLTNGGSLERDFLQVAAPRGSHRRPQVIARELLIVDERQDDIDRQD